MTTLLAVPAVPSGETPVPSGDTPGAAPARSLWHHGDFVKLWSGETISQLGSTVTREALPLTALLTLGASPLQMGILAALSGAPALLFGLLAGVWVDRLRRRPIMIVADLGRALLLLSIPAAALTGHLRLAQLLMVAPLIGTLTVLFNVAYESYVPTLVRRHQLVEANGKLALSGAIAEVTAPGLAGVLVQAITGPMAVLLDAVSFVCSAAMVALIRTPEPPPTRSAGRQHVLREATHGMGVVLRHPVLRAMGASTVMRSFFGNFFATVYALYALRELHMGPALLGLAVACGGVGSLVGAMVAGPATRRLGVGPAVLAAGVVARLASLLTPLAAGPALVAAGFLMTSQLVGDGASSVAEIASTSLQQALAPRRMLGRVNASMQLMALGVAPIGALTGGVLAEAIGARATLWVAVLGSVPALLWLVFSPLPHLHALPAGADHSAIDDEVPPYLV